MEVEHRMRIHISMEAQEQDNENPYQYGSDRTE